MGEGRMGGGTTTQNDSWLLYPIISLKSLLFQPSTYKTPQQFPSLPGIFFLGLSLMTLAGREGLDDPIVLLLATLTSSASSSLSSTSLLDVINALSWRPLISTSSMSRETPRISPLATCLFFFSRGGGWRENLTSVYIRIVEMKSMAK